MGQFDGKVALVTGGGTGIGQAAAQRFADGGAHVFIAGRRQAELDAAAEEIGGSVTAIAADISDLDDLDRLYAAIGAHGGGLDILFANAAAAELLTLEAVTEEHFDRIFDINVRGTLFTVQKSLPHLNDGASVILCGSNATEQGIEGFSVYSASKAALRSFARGWSNELRGRGIRVNVISPGPIDTSIHGRLVGAENEAATKAAIADSVPMGRMGQPAEVADAVAFLASPTSSFILANNLYVDGGMTQI